MTRVPPPRLAQWLLERRLSAEWIDFILGDLEEEFAARAQTSPRAARAWFWRQTLRAALRPPAPPAYFRPSGDPFMTTLVTDLGYAVRTLRKAPSFTLSVIAVLALGIGANAAIFSIVNTVLLRPLPFPQSERLVRIFHVPPQAAFPGITKFSVSPANFYDWQRSARLFEGMALYHPRQFALTGTGEATSVTAGAVGAGFFNVIKEAPALGRAFTDDEDSPAKAKVVMLSDGFWRTHLGGAPDVLGQTLRLDGDPYTIVGVMPARFSAKSWFITSVDLWVPLAYTAEARAVRDNHNDAVVARLRPGVTIAQANAEMSAISQTLERQYPQADTGWGATVIPLQELIVGDIRKTLIVILAAVGLVLLIACANVGNLLFARALGRNKELAIRTALGAGRGRVFQQLLAESLVLALAGGAVGLLLANVALQLGAKLLADQVPRADELAIDGKVLLFVAGISILTGVLAGTLPALRAGRTDLNETLKEGGRSNSAMGLRTRRALIICEIALSVMLLMGAGVMLRSLLALRSVDAGFDSRNILTLQVTLPAARYKEASQITAFFDSALARIAGLPGVTSVSSVDSLPFEGGSVQPIVLSGHAELLPRDQPTVAVRKISPKYFASMHIPLLRGRDVAASDNNVMLVSQKAAKLLWGDVDPIGRRVTLPLESKTVEREVIGVVGDIKQDALTEPAMASVYEQVRDSRETGREIVVKTSVPPTSIAASVTGVIHGLDREQPVQDIQSMDEVIDATLTSQRFSALLLGLFAALALVLASVGIYSVLSYIVRGRSREIGIRSALGASSAAVVALVVKEGMTPAAIGIAIGGAGALLSGRLLEKLVFGVSASDPLTLASVAGALALVALVACLVPAYRASRVNPLSVLRN